MAKKKSTPKQKTTPKKSPNHDYDQTECVPSRCRKCQSTNRSAYFGKPIVRSFTVIQQRPDGTKFTRLIKRRTKCEDCGQFRFVLSYEFHAGDIPQESAETVPPPPFLDAAK